MKRFFSQFFSILLVLAIVYGILSVRPYVISGDSMEPGLASGQIILLDRFSSRFWPLDRGEIIIYTDMNSQEKIKIKRLLGLPGETLKIQDGKVFIGEDETPIKESYLSEHIRTCAPGSCVDMTSRTYQIPVDSYFVLGDNRENSVDSRDCTEPTRCEIDAVKYIPRTEVIGRMILKF